MRKVLHVSHSLDTGGGPLYIKKIIQDIPQIDHYVVGNSGYYHSMFLKNLGERKVRLLGGKNLLRNVAVIVAICREESISIIHCHGRGAGMYSRLVKLIIPRIKIVYTVHGFHPDTLNEIAKQAYILMEKVLYHMTDVVINVSQSERELFIKKVSPSDKTKIHYIPNYITQADIQPRSLPVQLDSQYINLLYVGRLSHEKGIDILVEAWPKVKQNCRLYVIGYGPFEGLITANSDNSIVYLGKVENASSFLGNFDAIIIPSRFEGMPYIGLESMISKACVIVTPAVGITDLFMPATSYMAKDFSPGSLADAINLFCEHFTNDRGKIADMVKSNFERVQTEFSQKNASKIYQIYESLPRPG